ncbi:MAG: hypothetical protein FP816_19695 [Desulfobacteraceae bacterium]|nr:hypothetical protein [Desulfobacteraceae bacterium]MBU4002692.1 hypothetical protein [Pseudomonadota bacterium]MBU4055973.1 hypothetical protein [Pseudomonadota bacterium]
MSGNRPLKTHGWTQGLYQVSSTIKEVIGQKRETDDGRIFRYAKAGAAALAAGKLGIAANIAAEHLNQAILAAVAAGEYCLTLVVTAGTAIAENALRGGQFQINDAVGEGSIYGIESNSAISASGTEIVITLTDPIKVALTTASEFTLAHNPWNGVVESTTLGKACGVPLVAVPESNFYWAQTGGLGIGLIDGTPAVGSLLQQSNATAGAMEIYAAETIVFKPVAEIFGTAGISTEYKPVVYCID